MKGVIVGEGNCAGIRVSSHASPTDKGSWMVRQTLGIYFEGIFLLPACSATDVVHHSFVACVAQTASVVMHAALKWRKKYLAAARC